MDELNEKLRAVKLIVLDVDGVMTDGSIQINADGRESKSFNTQDGFGVVMAQKAGLRFGAITGRAVSATEFRIKQLKFEFYKAGCINKVAELEAMIDEANVEPHQVLYMGDDIIDLACAPYVGVFVAPANAQAPVLEHAEWVTGARGGHGAVREMINELLQAQDRLREVEKYFLN